MVGWVSRNVTKFLIFGVLLSAGLLLAHVMGSPVRWNREVSRVVLRRCASCHRPGGRSFSLLRYEDVLAHRDAIQTEVLSRRMPPWGAVTGFGDFENDQSLTQEEIEVLSDWIDQGSPKGNNPNVLPKTPKFSRYTLPKVPKGTVVKGNVTIDRAMTLVGLFPESWPANTSAQVTAMLPSGQVIPLVWLYEFREEYRHLFSYRVPIELPAGTEIRGVPATAGMVLAGRFSKNAKGRTQ